MNFILAADLHLRSTVPINRKDDYLKAQKRKFTFILNLCKKHNAILLVAGDLGHKSEWSNGLLAKVINWIKKTKVPVVATFGQHDLPFHSLEEWKDSALAVLIKANVVTAVPWQNFLQFNDTIVSTCPYGWKPANKPFKIIKPEIRTTILVLHKMVIKTPLWPGQKATMAETFLKKNRYDLIVTGDNHKAFTVSFGNRLLVNPGSMMRSNEDQKRFKPRVYLYDTDSRELAKFKLPIQKDVFRRTVDKDNENENDIDQLIKRLRTKKRITTSFKKNVKNWLQTYPQSKEVEKKIWEALHYGRRKKITQTKKGS